MITEPHETESWLRSLRQGESAALANLFHYYRPRLRQMVRLRMDPRLAARVDPSDVLPDAYAARWARRHRSLVAAAGLVLLAALGALAVGTALI